MVLAAHDRAVRLADRRVRPWVWSLLSGCNGYRNNEWNNLPRCLLALTQTKLASNFQSRLAAKVCFTPPAPPITLVCTSRTAQNLHTQDRPPSSSVPH